MLCKLLLVLTKKAKIAVNLFQIYEYCRQQLIKGYTKKAVVGIIKASNAINNILTSFEEGLKKCVLI